MRRILSGEDDFSHKKRPARTGFALNGSGGVENAHRCPRIACAFLLTAPHLGPNVARTGL